MSATYDLTEDADNLASDAGPAKKTRSPIVRGWINGTTIEFWSGGQKLDQVSLDEIKPHLLTRYALEGIARVYMLGSDRHEVVDGSGLPKREKPAPVAPKAKADPVSKTRGKLLAKLAKAQAQADALKQQLDQAA